MEEQPVNAIREYSRTALMTNRRALRDEETDCRRSISTSSAPTNISDIAVRLKNKSTVSLTDLQILKNSLLDDPRHVEEVLQHHGALRGLVRELTGSDASRQRAAAGCLCNVSTSDARACMTLLKAAGPYLVTALDTQNTDLAVTCAWALGNAAVSQRTRELMTSQGAVAKLAALLSSTNTEVQDAAILALTQFTWNTNDLKHEYMSSILQALLEIKQTESSTKLLFVISCHENFNQCINEEILSQILQLLTTIGKTLENEGSSKMMYVLRTLANITLNDSVYNIIVSYFSLHLDVLRHLIVMNKVGESVLWFLGNLYNYCNDSNFFTCLLN